MGAGRGREGPWGPMAARRTFFHEVKMNHIMASEKCLTLAESITKGLQEGENGRQVGIKERGTMTLAR